MSGSSHENLEREEALKPGSDRSFGLTMAVVFVLLGGVALWLGSPSWAGLWTVLAAGFGGLALAAPAFLAGPNRLWFRFGLLLNRIVSPLVMALLFFGVMLPIGLIMRIVGQRPLAMAFNCEAKSYWTLRSAEASEPTSMRKQF
jgi:hypothetical protein